MPSVISISVCCGRIGRWVHLGILRQFVGAVADYLTPLEIAPLKGKDNP
jgi:hypothetical protein